MKNSPTRLCPICKTQRTTGLAGAAGGRRDRVEELVLATLREQHAPVTLPVLAEASCGSVARDDRSGACTAVSSCSPARAGHARPWVEGEIAWGTVSDR